jgi:hypothetical protein
MRTRLEDQLVTTMLEREVRTSSISSATPGARRAQFPMSLIQFTIVPSHGDRTAGLAEV